MLLEIGRVCVKTAGHEANQKCVVIDNSEKNFVVIAGPRVKKRRCNIKHLEILPYVLSIKKGASEQEVIDALLRAGIVVETDLRSKPVGYTPRTRGGARKPVKPAKKEGPKEETKSKK